MKAIGFPRLANNAEPVVGDHSSNFHSLNQLGTRVPVHHLDRLEFSCGNVKDNITIAGKRHAGFFILLTKCGISESLTLIHKATSPSKLSTARAELADNEDKPISAIQISDDLNIVSSLAASRVLVETPFVGALPEVILISCLIHVLACVNAELLCVSQNLLNVNGFRELEELLARMLSQHRIHLLHQAMVAEARELEHHLQPLHEERVSVLHMVPVVVQRKPDMQEWHRINAILNELEWHQVHKLGVILGNKVKTLATQVRHLSLVELSDSSVVHRERSSARKQNV